MKEINIIKPLELTFEQKGELIHLCNKTWPELDFFFTYSYLMALYNKSQKTNNLKIHWFEFVVRMAIDEERDEFMNFYLNVCSPDETKE